MTAANLVALVLLLAIAAYACGGGTDYGAGLWDLVAGSADRGSRPRALVDYAMAPVWEVNNVWLVFAFVVTWTGFPEVFAAVFSAAWIALMHAALGLVLRGVSFAFRKPTQHLSKRRRYSAIFGLASILTPFMFAATLGGIASGRIPLGTRGSTVVTTWLNPTSVAFGILALAATAMIAAVFLMGDAVRFGAPDLVRYFRRRALVMAAAFVVVGAATVAVLRFDASFVFAGLWRGGGLAFTIASPVMAAATAVLVLRGSTRLSRLTAIAAVGSAVFAWGLAQRPYLLPTTVTVQEGAGAETTLWWLVFVVIVAVILVAPALALLYWLDARGELDPDHDDGVGGSAAPDTGGVPRQRGEPQPQDERERDELPGTGRSDPT